MIDFLFSWCRYISIGNSVVNWGAFLGIYDLRLTIDAPIGLARAFAKDLANRQS
jgi:hypothetical protein